MNNFKASVIVPAYNEEKNVAQIVERLQTILQKYADYEIIFIDDGSSDNTLDEIKKFQAINEKIHYLSFSRNFGHQKALKAGFDYSSGDCVISIDSDLQHPPELIDEMISKWQEGFDIVYTIRKEDQHLSFFKRKTSACFYKLISLFSEAKFEAGAADFRLLDKSVVYILKRLKEPFLFYRGLIYWVGFKKCAISYSPAVRLHGESKYNLTKMVSFALDGITSFSIKPLYFSIFLGALISLCSFAYGVYAVFLKFFTNKVVPGWTSVLVSVLFIGGLQFLILGIIGVYLGKLFIESKERPYYIIKESSFDFKGR